MQQLNATQRNDTLIRTHSSRCNKQAKKFVESLPQKVKESITRADADKLKEALEAAGGELEIA
jgi:ribosomal protein L7/L12